jgi:hypothetical protein
MTGNAQILAFCQPPDAIRQTLHSLCRLLRRMQSGEGGEEEEGIKGFVPRVLELAREVAVVVQLMGLDVSEDEEGKSLLTELEEDVGTTSGGLIRLTDDDDKDAASHVDN